MGVKIQYILLLILVIMGGLQGQQISEFDEFAEVDEACINFELSGLECRVDELVGGLGAHPCRFPYLVSIQLPAGNNSTFRHYCAGTLIAPNLLLTAAHCFTTLVALQPHSSNLYNVQDLSQVNVYAARNPFCRHMKGGGRVKIEKVFVHIDFVGRAVEGNDIAIAQLEQQFAGYNGPYMNTQAPQINYEQGQPYLYTIVGWGSTNYPDTKDYRFAQTVSRLQMGFIDYVNYTECNAKTKRYQVQVEEHSMICFGSSSVDSCQGDSGGPLIAIDISSQNAQNLVESGYSAQAVQYSQPVSDFQIGITSWGPDDKCGGRGVIEPGIYTNLQNYQQWIQQTLSSILQQDNAPQNYVPKTENKEELTYPIAMNISENSEYAENSVLKTITDEQERSMFAQLNGQSYSGSIFNQGIESIDDLVEASQQPLSEECKEEADSGLCKQWEQRYYFDQQQNICTEFIYGGCYGNKNNFLSLKECQDTCTDS